MADTEDEEEVSRAIDDGSRISIYILEQNYHACHTCYITALEQGTENEYNILVHTSSLSELGSAVPEVRSDTEE